MKLKEKKTVTETIGSSDGFWYDLTDGGYFKLEDVLEDREQIKAVKAALKLLRQLEEIYNKHVGEF